MSFGGGGGWGGGGGGAKEDEDFLFWGPPGSGAFLTPGPNYPYGAIEATKKWGSLAVLAILLLLANTD